MIVTLIPGTEAASLLLREMTTTNIPGTTGSSLLRWTKMNCKQYSIVQNKYMDRISAATKHAGDYLENRLLHVPVDQQ